MKSRIEWEFLPGRATGSDSESGPLKLNRIAPTAPSLTVKDKAVSTHSPVHDCNGPSSFESFSPHRLSGSVLRSDQLLRETTGADQ